MQRRAFITGALSFFVLPSATGPASRKIVLKKTESEPVVFSLPPEKPCYDSDTQTTERRARHKALCDVDPRQLRYADATYNPSGADVLALLRAVQGEVCPGATDDQKQLDAHRVAETLTNRFCYLKNRGYKDPFVAFVRAYAQPLSRRWSDPEGELCAAHPERCTEAMLRRRRAHQTRTDFDGFVLSAVRSALREGHVHAHTSAIHFAMPGVKMSKEMVQLTDHVERMNTLFATTDSIANWGGYTTA